MKKSINLQKLTVKSFVTSIERKHGNDLLGGATGGCANPTRIEAGCERTVQLCITKEILDKIK